MKKNYFVVTLLSAIFSLALMTACATNDAAVSDTASSFKLTSSAFTNNQRLDVKYCYTGVSGGNNISLPFSWEGAPAGTKSFALVIHDPNGGNWVHWAVLNIPADCNSISENASRSNNMPTGSIELNNEFGTAGYGGPQPPPGSGTHKYVATIYALGTISASGSKLNLSYQEITSLLKEMTIMDKATIYGTYSR